MEAAVSPDVATEHLAREIAEAGEALLRKAGEEPQKWWYAFELKDRTRNGTGLSAGALDIALTRLIDTEKFETRGDQVRVRT
jgi:hypothetical protein